MELKKVLIDSSMEVLPMFGIMPEFIEESEEPTLESANQFNVLIGLSNGLKGNIVMGISTQTALSIASAMMGGMEIAEIDLMVKSALGELANMLVGTALRKLGSEILIDFSPPTVVTGNRVFLMISRVKSYKLTFGLNNEKYHITFCIE